MKSYYMQLKPFFLKIVRSYKEDFTKFDKGTLRRSQNTEWLISGMRQCGTNLITSKEIEKSKSMQTAEKHQATLDALFIFMFEGSNQRFFTGENGSVLEVSRESAIEFFKNKTEYGKNKAA